jgi:hypothetical protein
MAQGNRSLAALALGAGLALGGMAFARGPMLGAPIFGQAGSFGGFFGSSEPASAPVVQHRVHRKHVAAFGGGQPVCVRLCDGSFFPTASAVGGEATCAAQCPDAPTALYTMTSDRIEDAVSSTGAPYSKLPVAGRFEKNFEGTCTCHRDVVASHAKELLHDDTLRRGDVVMMASGFRVYVGDGYGPSGSEDFVALASARNLPRDERATLAAMEKASAGSPVRAAPALLAARPKGRVTVENATR